MIEGWEIGKGEELDEPNSYFQLSVIFPSEIMRWINCLVNLGCDCLLVICLISPVTSSLGSSSSVKQEKLLIGYIFHGDPTVIGLLCNPVI